MDDDAEFAPEHTLAARLRFVALGIAGGVVVMALNQRWFLPWLKQFAASPQCYSAFGMSGDRLFFHSIFVWSPLALATLVGLAAGPRGYRILRDGQTPPIGEKVFRRTRVERGVKAQVSGYTQVFLFVPFLLIALWGWFTAEEMLQKAQHPPPPCAAAPAAPTN